MIHTITTRGADIHVMERPNGGWTIQQGRSHVLVTTDDARQLSHILQLLLSPTNGGQAVGPASRKPPIVRYRSPVTSQQVLDFVNAQPNTVAADLVEHFALTYEAAAKHLQRLYEQRLIRKPEHGVYAPLTAAQTDLLDGME